tara:strand:- start:233 stop:1492 length:1260 start_codon:yes stop_codon:yes gene_type:complete
MAPLSLSAWLERLELQHPVEIELGLERAYAVAHKLGLLTSPPTTLTVAGTNGKGSVVTVLSAALVHSGKRVGRYTSPHLNRFNERICIDDVEVQDPELVAAFEAIEAASAAISLTYFEVATLAALWIFRERSVDVQVLEVGLGGRLDAVNIIDADLSVITCIGLDHTDWLGDSRELIAIEKAGVARPAQPCVIADGDPPSSLISALDALGAQTCLINRDWRVGEGEMQTADHQNYRLPDNTGLLPVNIGAAIQALELSGLVTVDQSLVDQLASVSLAGRLSRLQMSSFELVLDVAHNVESVSELMQFLRNHPISGKTVAVFGVMGDKPIRDMLFECETAFDEWNLIDLRHVPRAMSTDRLAGFLEPMCTAINQGPFPDLWQSLLARVTTGDRVVVFGSFFSVGEATAYLAAHRHDGEQN